MITINCILCPEKDQKKKKITNKSRPPSEVTSNEQEITFELMRVFSSRAILK